MYASLVSPDSLSPEELDDYLAKGWFRLGRDLFTTSFLTFNDSLFDALWLRIFLPSFVPSRSQRETLRRAAVFRVEVGKYSYSLAKENLYGKYRESVSFTPARTLEGILPEDAAHFDSREVCLYEGDRLIACGVYDVGRRSAEGIVNFYDPDFKRYSLGKVLMLHKMAACKEAGKEWFYPGYVVPGYARFDYKLDLAPAQSEYYDRIAGEWVGIVRLTVKEQPLARTVAALVLLEGILHSFGLEKFSMKKYRFYDIPLDRSYSSYQLLTQPYFIYCFPQSGWEEVIIVFDVFSGSYQLLICRKMFTSTLLNQEDDYSEFLLREDRCIFKERNPFNFVFGLNKLLRRSPSAGAVNS